MLSLGLIGALCGMLLGGRYRVMIMAPAFLAGCILVMMYGVLSGATGQSILLSALIVVFALQAGYFCGMLLRLFQRESLPLGYGRRKPI